MNKHKRKARAKRQRKEYRAIIIPAEYYYILENMAYLCSVTPELYICALIDADRNNMKEFFKITTKKALECRG